MIKFLTENTETIEIILGTIGAIATWFGGIQFNKWKNKSAKNEASSGELSNISKNFEVYQTLIDDLEKRFKHRITDLEDDLEKIKTLNEELRKVISNQETYINKLQLKLSDYEKLEK